MENSSKIYIYQIIYRKEKNKRRVNSAENRGHQRGMKGEAGGVWECRKGREGLVGGKKRAGEKEKTES